MSGLRRRENASSPGGFRWPVRVYYEDTDAAGIVYYASYLKFMERARTEWLRSRGFDHQSLRAEHERVFVVARLSIDYHRPARLDEELQVSAVVSRTARASFDMNQSIYRIDGDCLCSANARLACLSTDAMKPVAIPSFLLAELNRED